jgi:aryl-alcohol dehydrogenase-like predicted oxidoreductase
VLARGRDIVAIPGTKRRAFLDENVAANDIVLSEAELQSLAEINPVGVAAGDRYPDLSTVNR